MVANGRESWGRSHVLSANSAGVDTESTVERHQRPADLVVIGRVQASALSLAKELVQVLVTSPAVVAGTVSQGLGTVVVNWLLIVAHGRSVGLCGVVGVVAGM